MGRGLALAIMLLALVGIGIAFVKPLGWPRADLTRSQLAHAAEQRAAVEKALAMARADLERGVAAKSEAERLATMDRERAARKIADLEIHAKAVMARAVDADRALSAAQATGTLEIARARAETEAARKQLARAIAERDDLATRLTATQVESQSAIAAAREDAARLRANQPDNAAQAEFQKRLDAARTEAAERFMAARNEADRQITAAQADAAKCRAELEKAQTPADPPPACPPPAAAADPAPSAVPIPAAEIARQLAATGRIALYIPFDIGSAAIKPNAYPSIDPIAAALRQDPKLKLLLVGHTDSQGDFGFNRTLSENRAKAIVDQLIAKHGIDRARLSYAGVADLSPIASNDTDAGRQRNRRVELVRR